MFETPLDPGTPIELGTNPRRVHVFSDRDIQALEAALGAQRPLLLTGEPGIGKSQLAEAAAHAQGWSFFSKTVDALTEPGDLMWSEDAVARLAEAQLAAARGDETPQQIQARLERKNFIRPGVLWRAFDPVSAAEAAGEGPPRTRRAVALVDEIDKAESAVPNGLLEALGAREFSVPDRRDPVRVGAWPLIVITSNDERPLPKAFVRRCIVYNMTAPEGEPFIPWLVERAVAHYPQPDRAAILTHVAQSVAADRAAAPNDPLVPRPGLAEYLDLLRALFSQGPQDLASLRQRAAEIGQFFLRKGHR